MYQLLCIWRRESVPVRYLVSPVDGDFVRLRLVSDLSDSFLSARRCSWLQLVCFTFLPSPPPPTSSPPSCSTCCSLPSILPSLTSESAGRVKLERHIWIVDCCHIALLSTLGLDTFVRGGCSKMFPKSCGHGRRPAVRPNGRGELPQRLRLPPLLPLWSPPVAPPPPPCCPLPAPQPPGFLCRRRRKVSGLTVPWIERWQGIAVGTLGFDVPEQNCKPYSLNLVMKYLEMFKGNEGLSVLSHIKPSLLWWWSFWQWCRSWHWGWG